MAARGEVNYLETYNSLLDEHLCEYLSRPNVWRHLKRQGLIRAGGEVVGEEEWRAGVQRRSVRDRTDREGGGEQGRLRAEDKSRMEAKHKHRQQLLSNYALADRIRLQAERHHPAYVREEDFTSLSHADREALRMERKQLAVHLPPNSTDAVCPVGKPSATLHHADALTQSRSTLRTVSHPSVSQSSQSTRTTLSRRPAARQSPYLPRPPPSSRNSPLPVTHKRSPKRGLSNPEAGVPGVSVPTAQKRRVVRTAQGGTPLFQSKATITLLFRGRGIKLNGRTLQESRSEVCVYQQHCGGNAVLVYQGLLAPGARFSFMSKRHINTTLGLTLYLNGLVDTRLSACCEYRYKPGHRVGGGGKASHYEFLSVRDAMPCFRCQAEIEVDRFIAAGGNGEQRCEEKPSVKNRGIKEAWVNTSYVNVSAKESSYSSSEFEEASEAASSPLVSPDRCEDRSESRREEGRDSSCGLKSESRGSSLSSQGTSSVSLDSDLNASHSDSEMPAGPEGCDTHISEYSPSPCEGRGYSSSLGQVTPDERLLTHSALSGNVSVLSQLREESSSTQDCIETDQSSMYVPTNTIPAKDIATSTPLRESSFLQTPPDTLSPLQHSNNTPPATLSPLQHSNTEPDSSLQHSITLPEALQPTQESTDSSHSQSSYTRANSSSEVDVTSSNASSVNQVDNELDKECEKSQSLNEAVSPYKNSTNSTCTPSQHSAYSVSVSSYSPEVNTSCLDAHTPAHLISSATNTHNHSSDDVTISSSSELEQNPDSDSQPCYFSGGSLVILRNLTPSEFQKLASLLLNETVSRVVMVNTRNFSPEQLDEIFQRIKTTVSCILISRSELTLDLLEVLLKHLKSVDSLEISHSHLPPDHFNTFLNKLHIFAPKLTKFNTSYCNLSFSSSLTNALNSLAQLEMVNLSGNVLKSAINFESLRAPRLQELCLDSTDLEEADLIGLCEYLRENAKIHTLSLKEITFSNSVLQRLLDVLQGNRTIKSLIFTPQTDLHINTKLISDILDKRAL